MRGVTDLRVRQLPMERQERASHKSPPGTPPALHLFFFFPPTGADGSPPAPNGMAEVASSSAVPYFRSRTGHLRHRLPVLLSRVAFAAQTPLHSTPLGMLVRGAFSFVHTLALLQYCLHICILKKATQTSVLLKGGDVYVFRERRLRAVPAVARCCCGKGTALSPLSPHFSTDHTARHRHSLLNRVPGQDSRISCSGLF